MSRRSEEEEKYLWSMLKDIDKEVAREEKRAKAKKSREIAKARKRMGVGKEQPSITDRFKAKTGVTELGKPTSLVPSPKNNEELSVAQLSVNDVSRNGQKEVTNSGGPCHLYGGGAPHQQINTRACGLSSQVVIASQSASLVPGSNREVGVAQLKENQMLQSGQTKVCVKSSRVEVADISSLRNNHHEEAKGNRDRGVTQSLLASTDSRQGEDSSTVSVALLKVMSESQVENGLVEQCSQSAHSNCTASRTNCTVSESNAKPQKKSANPEVDVMYKTKFKINNISGGKFNLKLSRNLVLENEGGET